MQDNYTKIDNRFIDEVMQTLKGSEIACCIAIFRKTSGWGKKSAAVSVDAISKITGITRRHTVIDALHSLEDKGIIKATKTTGKTTIYGFCYHLNQNLETSDEKRTSDTENTSAENVTSTRDAKRTSTSDEKRTSSSIYKEKEKKEKEKREIKPDFYEFNKKEINAYIQNVIENGGNIHNEHAYRKKLLGQFIKGDKATISEFNAWFPAYRCNELQKQYRMKPFIVVIDKDRFCGELLSIEYRDRTRLYVTLRDPDTYKERSFEARNLEALEDFLEKGHNT